MSTQEERTPAPPIESALSDIVLRPRWELPRGRIVRRDLHDGKGAGYLVYIPLSGGFGAACMVSIHGLARNVREHAESFVGACEQAGVVLLVPHFDEGQFSDYQRLGRVGRGRRADLFLLRCLDELTFLAGVDTHQVSLFGHSAGAQFVQRFVMAHPHRVARAVVAAAGWYTFPDNRLKFPYGVRTTRKLPGIAFVAEEFLTVPTTVIVGVDDTGQAGVRRDAAIDEQQGVNRRERARRWTHAMQVAAERHGMPSAVTCIELDALKHGFAPFRRRSSLKQLLFRLLFTQPNTDLHERSPLPGPGDRPTAEVDSA